MFLPGESHGQRSLEGYRPWSHKVGHSWGTDRHGDVKKRTLPVRPAWVASACVSSAFSLDPSFYSLGPRDPGSPRPSGCRTSAHALLSFWEALPQRFLFLFLLPFSGKRPCPQRGLPLYLIFSGSPVIFRCLILYSPLTKSLVSSYQSL